MAFNIVAKILQSREEAEERTQDVCNFCTNNSAFLSVFYRFSLSLTMGQYCSVFIFIQKKYKLFIHCQIFISAYFLVHHLKIKNHDYQTINNSADNLEF
jgi:hypothetical protein